MFAKIMKCASTTLLALLVFASLAATSAAAQQFVTVDVPGATTTYMSQINNNGQMVGGFTDSDGATHGVLVSAGVFTTIDCPGSTNTQLYGINDNGQMVGIYYDANGSHGFQYVNGTCVAINNPAEIATLPLAIDDLGDIVGAEVDTQGGNHGFVFSGGIFTSIDFPGANLTNVLGTNLRGGSLTGVYSLPSSPANTFLGFTYINGQFATITFPQSPSTIPNDINNGGQVAGSYTPAGQSNFEAFLLNGTTFTTLEFPGATSTNVNGLNDLGQLAGWYFDASNVLHGFLASSGPFAYIANPASNTVSVLDTTTNLVATTIPVPLAPWDLAVTPDQKHVYVTEVDGATVAVIDTASNTVSATIPVGNAPYALAIAPNGNFVYVTNETDNTASVISTASNTVVATVTVGTGPFAVAVTPDSSLVYVSNLGSSTLSVIDTTSNTVSTTVSVPVPLGMAFTSDGAFAYVTNFTSVGTVTVLAIPSNEIVTTIPLGVGASPIEVAITPDGRSAYVTDDGSATVSVINIASNSLIANVTTAATPFRLSVTPDGSLVYVGDFGGNVVSVLQTSDNTVVASIPMPGGVSGVAIVGAAPTSQTVSQPLSPTQPNVFNFGTNNQSVQYPPGTNFKNVNMNTVAVQLTPAEFKKRVSGTSFANATCIVYSGNGGNCVDYMVTCTNANGHPITCPGEAQPTIAVETDFTTAQSIVNPGYLTAPIGTKNWQNIFVGLGDPKVKGKTKGFSEFVAVDLGAGNAQGLAKYSAEAPFCQTEPRIFTAGTTATVRFLLTSVVDQSPVSDAQAGLTVTRTPTHGRGTSQVVFSQPHAFAHGSSQGRYTYQLSLAGYVPGQYELTVFGNAFPAHSIHFRVVAP